MIGRECSSPLLLRRSRLRTHPSAIMLDREDVAVEGRGPLLTLHGHLEIAQSITDISLDLAPIELRMTSRPYRQDYCSRASREAGFDEFVVESVQLARIDRIAQLADEIASPN